MPHTCIFYTHHIYLIQSTFSDTAHTHTHLRPESTPRSVARRPVARYSAFSFSEAVCVNKFARETRDVARKHGMSILNIERFAAALRVECGAGSADCC